jgi:hypothetical protein
MHNWPLFSIIVKFFVSKVRSISLVNRKQFVRLSMSNEFTQDNVYDPRNRPKPSLTLSFTAVYGVWIAHLVVIVLRPFFVVSYTVGNCRRWPENGVSDRLRSFTIRWNTAVIRSLPNESNTIKNARLRPRLIDLGRSKNCKPVGLDFGYICAVAICLDFL